MQRGPPGLFVALGVAGSYALLRANRPLWAGAALGAAALKPQLPFLVPVALLAARQARAFIGSAIALGALAPAPALPLGTPSFASSTTPLPFPPHVPVNR